MTMLFWSLLNIALFLYFIFLCLKIILLTKRHLGAFASLVFAFGLVSFMASPNADRKNLALPNNEKSKILSVSNLAKNTDLRRIELETGFLTKVYLNVGVSEKENGQVALTNYAGIEGLVSGLNWQTQNVDFQTTKKQNGVKYTVHGILHWKLLGMTIYSQLKVYQGAFTL